MGGYTFKTSWLQHVGLQTLETCLCYIILAAYVIAFKYKNVKVDTTSLLTFWHMCTHRYLALLLV